MKWAANTAATFSIDFMGPFPFVAAPSPYYNTASGWRRGQYPPPEIDTTINFKGGFVTMFFRLIILVIKRLFHFKKTDLLEPCYTSFLVGPLDLDTNFHVNNGRYLSIMDMGRFDMLIKPKVFWKLILAGYYPVVVSESIRFKKSLALFNYFTIKTEIESWDEKDFYIRQIFYHKNKIMAVGYIKGRFMKRGQKKSVATSDVYKFLNYDIEAEKKSDLSKAQDSVENELNKVIYGSSES